MMKKKKKEAKEEEKKRTLQFQRASKQSPINGVWRWVTDFIHLQCWEAPPFWTIQRQRSMK